MRRQRKVSKDRAQQIRASRALNAKAPDNFEKFSGKAKEDFNQSKNKVQSQLTLVQSSIQNADAVVTETVNTIRQEIIPDSYDELVKFSIHFNTTVL